MTPPVDDDARGLDFRICFGLSVWQALLLPVNISEATEVTAL